MDCFIKKVWQNKEGVHTYFVRFSRGHFKNRAVLKLQKTTRIKLKGSFEWANDFVRIASELADIKFSGIIFNKEELPELAEFPKKKKTGIIQYEIPNISSGKIKQIEEKAYCMLLEGETPDLTLKMKKKLPKPGKSGDKKIDDKFCQLEADLKYWPQIKEAFMLPECKKCKINHTFIIEELILPEGEKDFVKIRELTKRKGKIIRNLEIDKQEAKEEKDFVA